MNSTSGEFNYTGLVANMEMKAGMFYGMSLRAVQNGVYTLVWAHC
jgi:hypothetical protein